jgi:hypothetical protein
MKTRTTYTVYISVVEGSRDNVLLHTGHNKAEAKKVYNQALKSLKNIIKGHEQKNDLDWSWITREDMYQITDFSNCWRINFDIFTEYIDEDGEVDEMRTEFDTIEQSDIFFARNMDGLL